MDAAPSRIGTIARTGCVRMLIVDDDPGVRALLEINVELDPRFELVGSAGSGRELREQLWNLADIGMPDVILLDVTLPDGDGITLLDEAREMLPCCHMVVLTGWDDEQMRQRAERAGAEAVFPKGSPPGALLGSLYELAYAG